MRIRDDLARVNELVRTMTDEHVAANVRVLALDELVGIMTDENVAADVRLLAAEKILDIGWGKVGEMPAPAPEMTGSNGGNDH